MSFSCTPPIGAPDTFSRPIVCSWSSSVERSQVSISIRIRRVTMYVPPRNQRCGSSDPAQTKRVSAAWSSERMLFVPSLNPCRLRGVTCVAPVAAVRPKPSCSQRAVTTPRPIRASWRIAWNATCGSSAHAWTQMSPSERPGSRVASPGSALERGEERRPPRRQAEPVLAVLQEQRRPEPHRDRQPRAARPSASPVSTGGSNPSPPAGPTGCPAVSRTAALVPGPQDVTQLARPARP